MNKTLSLAILLLLLISCSSEKKPGNVTESSEKPAAGAPYALELTPKEASRKTTLNLIANGFNISDAKIEWMVNGRPVTTLAPTQFNGADATKRDSVQARAVVGGREVRSNAVQIMNAPPEITKVKILPEVFKFNDTLSVEVEGNDADGDQVSFLYEWTKNGEPAGKAPSIEATVKRGDRVSVKGTSYDGESYGSSVVLNREIQNLPPMIIENNVFNFDGKIYSYQVKATDPDEDTLRYSLEVSPNGMTIDPSKGLINWPVPPEFKGEVGTIAVVDDGHGGIARYNLKIIIR
jgi:hypothetical protein